MAGIFNAAIFNNSVFNTGETSPVATPSGPTPAGAPGRRRRMFILPDGRHVLAAWDEIYALAEQFSEETRRQAANARREARRRKPVIRVVGDEVSADLTEFEPLSIHDLGPLKLELPNVMRWKNDSAEYAKAVSVLMRRLEEEFLVVMLS